MMAVCLSSAGCSQQDHCSDFYAKARAGAEKGLFEAWVDEKNERGLLERKMAVEGPFYVPGEFNVPIDGPAAKVLGPDYGARVIVGVDGRPESIFFATRNFGGVLVMTRGSRNTQVLDSSLTLVNERVSVMCSQKD